MSRSSVSRKLTEAKRRGIVKISFTSGYTGDHALGRKLQRMFALKDLVLVPDIAAGSEIRLKERLGAAAASYISETIRPGHKVGISWGTTLFEVALRLRPQRVLGVCVVQLNGCVGQGAASYLGAQVLQMIATKLGAQAFSFPAPAIVRDPALSEALRKEPSIAGALEVALGCDIAVFTVGVVDPACVLVRAGYLTPADMNDLRTRGAVGDICSRFFDSRGQVCNPDLDRRTLGLSLRDLVTIPLKIMVAGGTHKVAGILGALRAGYADVLITDETSAHAVMDLAAHQMCSARQA
ncbi:MAG: sugar-binding transcriptional regulator [Bacillota bacterium]